MAIPQTIYSSTIPNNVEPQNGEGVEPKAVKTYYVVFHNMPTEDLNATKNEAAEDYVVVVSNNKDSVMVIKMSILDRGSE